jgi:hypothetical protein
MELKDMLEETLNTSVKIIVDVTEQCPASYYRQNVFDEENCGESERECEFCCNSVWLDIDVQKQCWKDYLQYAGIFYKGCDIE